METLAAIVKYEQGTSCQPYVLPPGSSPLAMSVPSFLLDQWGEFDWGACILFSLSSFCFVSGIRAFWAVWKDQ